MPEADTVRGMDNSAVPGPPSDPPSHTVLIPPWDQFQRGLIPKGDPANTSRRYFIETTSPNLADIVVREEEV